MTSPSPFAMMVSLPKRLSRDFRKSSHVLALAAFKAEEAELQHRGAFTCVSIFIPRSIGHNEVNRRQLFVHMTECE